MNAQPVGWSKRSIWWALLVVGIALLGLAACGGDGGSSSKGSSEGKEGGTLKVNLAADTDHVDPALAYYQISVQMLYSACTTLLNYPDKPAPEGSRLQPEAAESMPTVTNNGKTYTFTIRPGFKFSPPSNEEVTADHFRFVLERNLNPKLQSPSASFISDIVGAQAVLDGKTTSLSGVKVNGNKLTINLTKANPDFLNRMAMWFFCAIPKTTSVDPSKERPVPTSGPYYVSQWTPERRIVLKRNPNYTGDRPHKLDEIVYAVGVNKAQSVLQIKSGQADYAADGITPASQNELGRTVGPDSDKNGSADQQLFVNPQLAFQYLGLNTTRPLFKDVNVRKAVAYAIDRPAMVRLSGKYSGTVTDQYIPPGLSAYKDADIYPLDGPDVAKAKELMGGKTGKAVLYTCNQSPCPERAQLVQANLKVIGIDVQIKQLPRSVQFTKEGVKGEPFDIADEGWIADYADPSNFINKLLDGRTIQAANNVNFSYFNDPVYNRKMDEAALKVGEDRDAAYAALDEDIARNAAPLVAYMVPNNIDFFSSRVGCYVYQPVYGMNLASLCLK
jgi:ABC-type oligopeptide transport system substrate-binding subunit